MEDLNIFAAELVRVIAVPVNRITQIIARKRAITADTVLRLARYFGTLAECRMNLQKTYELDLAHQEVGDSLAHIPHRSGSGGEHPAI